MKRFSKKTIVYLLIGMVLLTGSFSATGVLAASQFMDYFKPMPIIGSLSSSCWGAAAVGPRDQSNGLEDKTMTQYCYWDGGIIKGPDGTYHMFASRWSQSAGHNGWFGSVAVHATSSNLYGPYTDKGMCWPNDQGGKGHNVVPFQLKDGRYAVLVSETRRPADIFVSNSLDGPWSKLGSVSIASNSYSSLYTASNVYIMLRPDGRYGLIERDGVIGIADNVTGPYTIQGTNIYARTSGCPTGNMEDPVMWYSGGLYHIVVNKWDTRKAYHLTSADGISNWKLEPGYAYDPTANFLRYTNGTVNHWNKLERPNVYMENGHVVAMTLAAIDVAKDQELGNDSHGSKVIVVPFDGASLDPSTGPTPTPTPSTATPTPTPSTITATPTPTPSGATATPTPSGATATPTPSGATATPTPSATSGGIKVQFFNGNTAATSNTIYTNFKVVNTGTASVNLSDVKMRYYFTNDGTQADSFACDYATIGAGNVTGSFTTVTGTNADRCMEVGFTSAAGTLAAGASAEVKGRAWKSDWSNFTQTNDYSFNATATNYVDAATVTGYLAGSLKWGTEP